MRRFGRGLGVGSAFYRLRLRFPRLKMDGLGWVSWVEELGLSVGGVGLMF